MTINPDSIEIIKANVVLIGVNLLPSQDELAALQKAIQSDITLVGTLALQTLPVPGAAQGRILAIPRDRIEIEVSRVRSVISRDYPAGSKDLARIAEVYELADGPNSDGVKAYGVNFEFTVQQTSSMPTGQYLGVTLLNTAAIERAAKMRLIGGAAKLILQGPDDQRWTFTLEPRFNDPDTDRVFLSLNVHVDRESPPTVEQLRHLLDLAAATGPKMLESLTAEVHQ